MGEGARLVQLAAFLIMIAKNDSLHVFSVLRFELRIVGIQVEVCTFVCGQFGAF
jgi:hypothetical protein